MDISTFNILNFQETAIFLLFIAAIFGFFLHRRNVPYTVSLVIGGLLLALVFSDFFAVISDEVLNDTVLTQIILGLLVPPLIFDAAFHLKWKDLKSDLGSILILAIFGVLITMFTVGYVIQAFTPLGWGAALVFGSLIAATDPVAVVALLRSLGLPKRIQVLLEGESLLNDGTAIVVFTIMVGLADGIPAGAAVHVSVDNLFSYFGEFLIVALGGLAVGLMVGSIVRFFIARMNNYLLEVTFTLIAAYGSYLIAEHYQISGVLAVVAAGLILGNLKPGSLSPTTRNSLYNFWELGSFLANSFIFMLIGLEFELHTLQIYIGPILWAILAVTITRALVIYPIARFSKVPGRLRHVLFIGGLRGAISLALALSLTGGLHDHIPHIEGVEMIQAMTIGVVLFTIIVPGGGMGWLVSKLGLTQRNEIQDAYEAAQARAMATQAAFDHVESMHNKGLVSEFAWEMLQLPMRRQIQSRAAAVRQILQEDRSVAISAMNTTYREALNAQRSTYAELFTAGVISEEISSQLINEVDNALAHEEIIYPNLMMLRSDDQPPITKMISAIVDQNDLEDTLFALNIMNVPTTQLDSLLEPEGVRTTTLLMGIEEKQVDEVIEAISSCANTPVDYERPLFSFLGGKRVTRTGTSIYILDIERFEEI